MKKGRLKAMEKKIWALCRQLLEEKKFRELRELLCEENEVYVCRS